MPAAIKKKTVRKHTLRALSPPRRFRWARHERVNPKQGTGVCVTTAPGGERICRWAVEATAAAKRLAALPNVTLEKGRVRTPLRAGAGTANRQMGPPGGLQMDIALTDSMHPGEMASPAMSSLFFPAAGKEGLGWTTAFTPAAPWIFHACLTPAGVRIDSMVRSGRE